MRRIKIINNKTPVNESVSITTTTTKITVDTATPESNILVTTDANTHPPESETVRNVGLYFALYFNDETQNLLREFCQQCNINCAIDFEGKSGGFTFHCTVIYSDNEILYDTDKFGIYNMEPPMQLKPIGFDVFGPDKNCLVLKLDNCRRLSNIRNRCESLGLTSKFPDFRPHATLSYTYVDDGSFALHVLPKFPLVIDKIEVSERLNSVT